MNETEYLKGIIEKMIALDELNQRYGHISCFDAKEAYDQMEELSQDIYRDIRVVVENNTDYNGFALFSYESLHTALRKITDDVLSGELEGSEIHLYTQDEFIETYVVGGLSEEAVALFDEIFYYMDSDSRSGWLEAKYIDLDNRMYSNRNVDFVIVVDN